MSAVLVVHMVLAQLTPSELPVVVDAGVVTAPSDVVAPDADDELPSDDDLDSLAAVEAATIDSDPSAALNALAGQQPYGSVLRDRLEAAATPSEEAAPELPFSLTPVDDVSRFDVSQVKDRYDIPVEMHPLVEKYIHFFQNAGRKWFVRWVARSTRFIPLMQPILEAKGLPRDTVYLAMIESGFNTQARSWARAVGPWQFIAGTAKMFNLREDFWVDERRDPVRATEAAAAYLALLHQTLGHWYLAWAGYNAGGGRVRWMIDAHQTRNFWELIEKKGFAKETQHYVPKLIACALVAKHPQAFGFSPDEFESLPPFTFDEVALTDAVDLEVLATSAGTTVDVLQELNPAVKRWCTPPATEKQPFMLRIPPGRGAAFKEAFAKYAPSERLNFKIHRVARGDTLSKIALAYHSAEEAIMRMNGLASARLLRLGVDLVVPVPSATALKAGKGDGAFQRQVVRARRAGVVATRPEEQVPAGTVTTPAPTVHGTTVVDNVGGKVRATYAVARGDSLWAIARRFDVRVADLREWNDALGSTGRGLKVGTPIVIFPGAKAQLPPAKK
ncbi:MAG: LysM peptidoglycan-binding domain-containing protein [Archangium sp.]|nr:LysM peptidoglycan-binding domain-containing protein [Archangium sp.]